MTTRVRIRRSRERRDIFPIAIEQELADYGAGIVHEAMYRFRLTRYLLPQPGATAAVARAQIETARDHETRMWSLFPDGPAA